MIWITCCDFCVAPAEVTWMGTSWLWSGRAHASLSESRIDKLGCKNTMGSCLPRRRPRDSRRAAAFLRRSTSHLPKASSSVLLGKLLLPFSTNTRLFFLPIACLAAPAIARHYHAIMHAKPSPRKPRAMKQILAWLVRASFLIKHGEWTPCRTIRVK
jgi:hypothetical protein